MNPKNPKKEKKEKKNQKLSIIYIHAIKKEVEKKGIPQKEAQRSIECTGSKKIIEKDWRRRSSEQ